MLRRFLPFSMPAGEITEDFVKFVNKEINNMPRAILGFKTPVESRVKLALPAIEACDNMKQFGVAFHS
jgi:IS30 family transposase